MGPRTNAQAACCPDPKPAQVSRCMLHFRNFFSAVTSGSCTAVSANNVPAGCSVGTCGSSIANGQTCSFLALPGFGLNGQALQCNNGQLSGTQTCTGMPIRLHFRSRLFVANACPPLASAPQFGTAGSCSVVISPGATCSISCNANYQVSGRPLVCDATTFTLTGTQTCVAVEPGLLCLLCVV